MSKYTDIEHEIAIDDTIYWKENPKETPEQQYRYGEYLYRLKDYHEAIKWYRKALDSNFIPAGYSYLECISKTKDSDLDENYSSDLKSAIFDHYYHNSKEAEDFYRLGMLYLRGWGVDQNDNKAAEAFEIAATRDNGGALYQMAIFHLDGKGQYQKDYLKARDLLRKSYDAHYEEAIFKDFEIFPGSFGEYDYQREIKEAYSFKIGQYIRIVEVRGTQESIETVIEMYLHGFPGDTGAKKEEYSRKADKYIKMLVMLK